MNEYALTERERKWLENRTPVCCELIPPKSFDGKPQSRCPDCKYNQPQGQCSIYHSDYRDAAEFEARCKVKMANKPIKSKPCAYGKSPRDYKTCPFFEMQGDVSLPFCRSMCVHIAVEQEMEESCPKN